MNKIKIYFSVTVFSLTLFSFCNIDSSGILNNTSNNNSIKFGDSFKQNVTLTAGTPFLSEYSVELVNAASSGAVNKVSSGEYNIRGTNTNTNAVEVSIVAEDGIEVLYNHQDVASGNVLAEFTPEQGGRYQVVITNNSGHDITVSRRNSNGGDFDEDEDENDENDEYGNVYFRSDVHFDVRCYQFDETLNKSIVVNAPPGRVYVRATASLGEVLADKSVVDMSEATITISDGVDTLSMLTLADDLVASSARPGWDAEVLKQDRQDMFGWTGELYVGFGQTSYTIHCTERTTLAVDHNNPSSSNITMRIQNTQGIVIDKTYAVDVVLPAQLSSGYPSFVDNHSYSCFYDEQGVAMRFAFAGETCRQIPQTPSATIGVRLPSETVGTDPANDPTKILFTNIGESRDFHMTVLELNPIYQNIIDYHGCVFTGRQVTMPMDSQAPWPLDSFRANEGEIISASGYSATGTKMTDFYQGPIRLDSSQNISYYPGDLYQYWQSVYVNQIDCFALTQSEIVSFALQNVLARKDAHITGVVGP